MFDEQKVEDMFEPSAAPQPRVSPPPRPPAVPAPVASGEPVAAPGPHVGGGMNVFKGVLIALFVLALIGGAGYAAWRLMSQSPSAEGPVRSVEGDGVVEEDEIGSGAPTEIVDDTETTKPTFLDSDGDGLTNAEELEAGTDVGEPDTDSDGLGDREEVKVYDTDPREADTDEDGFLDGQEVAGGYNPNGEGRLFNVPTE